MKKIFLVCFVAICVSFTAQAQTTDKTKTETKVKRTKSLKDRVHNTIHPKRKKHYSGVKVKQEVKKEG